MTRLRAALLLVGSLAALALAALAWLFAKFANATPDVDWADQ